MKLVFSLTLIQSVIHRLIFTLLISLCGMTRSKLSDSDKQEILSLYRKAETTSTLAERYGVSSTTIRRVLKGGFEQEYESLTNQEQAQSAGQQLSHTNIGDSDRSRQETTQGLPLVEETSPVAGHSSISESTFGAASAETGVKGILTEPSTIGRPQLQPTPQSNQVVSLDESPSHAPKRLRKRILTPIIAAQVDIPVNIAPTPETSATSETTLLVEPPTSNDFESVNLYDSDEQIEDFKDLDEELDSDLLDLDDEFEDDSAQDPLSETVYIEPIHPEALVHVLPLSEAAIPRTCYLVIDRSAELITRPLKDFGDLGKIPSEEIQEKTLPIFDNHRVARRFSNRTQRVIKIPDGDMLQKACSHLHSKGITRLLINGQVYSV